MMRLLTKAKALAKRLRKRFAKPEVRASKGFMEAVGQLRPGDVAIDCGANVGVYTEILARTGAQVHAFEPDPACFEVLTRKLGGMPNVTLHQKAVSTTDGVAKLFMKPERDPATVDKSHANSLLATKTNIDTSHYVNVDTVDFASFVKGLGPVKLMKMDIEGFEIEVINHLIDKDVIGSIGLSFVELHDRKTPSLVEPTARLRSRLESIGAPVDLTWH